MKDSFKKYLLVPVIIVLVLAIVIGFSALISSKVPKKEAPAQQNYGQEYDPSAANVRKNGFTFTIIQKEVKFPLRLKEDLIDKGFTFMRYDEVKKVYLEEKVDTTIILENVDEKVVFGQSFFRAVVKDTEKPINSLEGTDVVGVICEKTDSKVFSVNGYGCGDRMSALIDAFGKGYKVTSEKGTSAEEGVYSVEYKSDNMTVTITSENGKIIALNAEMIQENN